MWVYLLELDCRETLSWETVRDNEFFILQEGREGAVEGGFVFYRIVMKGNTDSDFANIDIDDIGHSNNENHNRQQHTLIGLNVSTGNRPPQHQQPHPLFNLPCVKPSVVALSAEWPTIEAHWRWIEDNILFFFGYFDRSSEPEEQELWAFLGAKTRYLADVEPETREKDLYLHFVSTGKGRRGSYLQRRLSGSPGASNMDHSDSDQSADEQLTAFKCTLVRKVPRWGDMRLSRKRIAFSSRKLNTRVALPWKKVSSVTAATIEDSEMPAILIKATNNSEFLFVDFPDFKQAYTAIVETWQLNRIP